jgi:short subunit dehydrogenase-like uncharacterized protein
MGASPLTCHLAGHRLRKLSFKCGKIMFDLLCRGGVYTPGVAFGRTSLLEELDKHGTKFEVLSLKEN